MPSTPPSDLFSIPFRASLLISALLLSPIHPGAAGFSSPEWSNPGRSGAGIWIRNPGPRVVHLQSFHVRTLGFRDFRQVAFTAGGRRLSFDLSGDPRGHWVRLKPRVRGHVRIGARDSVLLTAFECGSKAGAPRGARKPLEEFVLDLRLVDSRGDTAQVKVVELAPRYQIADTALFADWGPEER